MNLERIVGSSPGNPGGEQIGHAGLEIAALVRILLRAGEIGDLARDMESRRPSWRACSATRGKAISGLPNWMRSCAYRRPRSSADCATPTARAAVWIRADSKVCINCRKPSPSTSPSKFRAGDCETVEGQFVFLHAAIAEHLDFAPPVSPSTGKGVLVPNQPPIPLFFISNNWENTTPKNYPPQLNK